MKGGTKIQLENIVGGCKTRKRMTISLTDVYKSFSTLRFSESAALLQAPFFFLSAWRSHPGCDGAHDLNFRDRLMTKASDPQPYS